MKRISILLPVLFLGICPVLLTAQQTDAPDQDAVSKPAVVSTTNTVEPEAAKVTPEKEVIATGGALYNDGSIDYAPAGAKFAVQSQDAGAGVKNIYIWVDNAAMKVYSTPVGFTNEGRHSIAFQVEDNVGNVSAMKTYSFIMDTTAPSVKIVSAFKGVKMTNGVYVPANNKFTVLAQDKLSGVKSISYAVDGGEFMAYDKNIVLADKSGMHTILYRSTDNVGNISKTMTNVFYIDGTAPVVTIASDPAAFVKDGVNYISGKSSITITAKDADTDVVSIMYYIDAGEAMQYSYPFKLTSGEHTIKAIAVDAVGNESQLAEYKVSVDASDPSAYVEAGK
jgi:hypothetical protein